MKPFAVLVALIVILPVKLVVEPGGAIGLAALLAGKINVKGKIVVGVLSGGNVDADMFDRLIAA